MEDNIKYDLVEDSEEYKKIKQELEEKIKVRIGNKDKGLGFCYIYWNCKKEILKEEYNIDWKSPAELNPWIEFD